MIILTIERLKRIIVSAIRTDCELYDAFRKHGIPFCLENDGYTIATKKGKVSVSRSGSRFEIHNVSPVPYRN